MSKDISEKEIQEILKKLEDATKGLNINMYNTVLYNVLGRMTIATSDTMEIALETIDKNTFLLKKIIRENFKHRATIQRSHGVSVIN